MLAERDQALVDLDPVFLRQLGREGGHGALGRGRGVVIGMLGCFLFGLIWIVTFYFVSQDGVVPVMNDLDQYNLLVGIGFMAVGFTFATKWE